MNEFDTLIALYTSKSSSFYTDFWVTKPMLIDTIPVLTFNTICKVPLHTRLYENKSSVHNSSFVFFVEKNNEMALIKKDERALQAAELPIPPLSLVFVLFSNEDYAIEQSLWCYGHGSIPYIGDSKMLEATSISADVFKCTILLCDVSMLMELYRTKQIPESVKTIIVIDSHVIEKSIRRKIRKTYMLFSFLGMPEIGVIGSLHEHSNGYIYLENAKSIACEVVEGICMVTALALPTPLVRYNTGISCGGDTDNKIILM